MGEIFTEAFRIYTLPLTTALVLVCIYWLMVAIGFLDTDSLDVDADVDADVDLDHDLDIEAHAHTGDLDIDLDHDVDHDVDSHAHDGGSFFGDIGMAFLRFVNVSEVPLMIVLSLMVVFMWSISMISNYHLNPSHSLLIATGLFVANFLLSTLITKILTTPLKPVMRAFKKNAQVEEEPVIGSIGQVRSGEVTMAHGQIEVMRGGTPIYLHAHISEGHARLKRGDSVIVVDFDQKKDSYLIKPNHIKTLED